MVTGQALWKESISRQFFVVNSHHYFSSFPRAIHFWKKTCKLGRGNMLLEPQLCRAAGSGMLGIFLRVRGKLTAYGQRGCSSDG